ncbi:MAG TPA: endonuclease/exonuclease/phosphatase family protein [Jatrophihabitans sp.]|nr:endonuclease/exonuclease/phosphatase family protein [Jatrophihabitans sp.]
MTTLRVLSYNVRSLRDDPEAVGRVMRSADPHVAIVQEAPRFLRWRMACVELARRAGLVLVTGGRASAANLVLSSLAVDVLARHELTLSPQRKLHQRGVAMAVLRLAGRQFAVAGTHLDLIEPARLAHLDELAALVADRLPDVPVIVGGDLNAVPGSATWQRLLSFGADVFATAGSGDGFTYSAAQPVRRIDGLFADPRLRPVRAEVVDSADVRIASDHLPLLAEFEFD